MVNDLTDVLLGHYLANPFRVTSVGIMMCDTFLKITKAVHNCSWVILSYLIFKKNLANPLRMNSLGIMLWGTSLAIDISKVQYVNGLVLNTLVWILI